MGEISSLAHLFYSCYLALTIIERHTTKNTEMINLNIQGLHWNPEDHTSLKISVVPQRTDKSLGFNFDSQLMF